MNQPETARIPAHIAVIMDGNGRWAKKRLLSRAAGHRAGAQALRKLAEEAGRMGVRYLTVYAFSTENWARPQPEVENLMNLLREYIQRYIDDSKKNDMRICVIGRRDRVPADLLEKIQYLEELTRAKPGLRITIALDYGGRDEIARAARRLCRAALEGRLAEADIDADVLAGHLDTAGLPDPELLIRTGGELRLSNFLLWQAAYTELYVTDKFWPDFTIRDLHTAVAEFCRRDRRFGGAGKE